MRPSIVKRDIDFSENGTIKNKRQIQSQYWVTIGYTLFISILSWLEAAEWNKTTGTLPIGAEVTVFGEFAGENVCMHSFWSTITKIISVEDEVYEVTDAHGQTHQTNRSDM